MELMESEPVSTFKMEFKAENWKIEKYVTEIAVPPNFLAIQPGESATFSFPECKRFQSGILSKTPLSKTIRGCFSRQTCELSIHEFLLPERIEDKTLTMKCFRVEILANNTVIGGFLKEFPAPHKLINKSCSCAYHLYSSNMNLFSIWKDNVSLIRITWNIRVQESAAEFVIIDSKDYYDKVKESDRVIAMNRELASFHDSEYLSDVNIRCGSEVIPGHSFALALVSPVFRTMFGTEMKEKKNGEVIIEDIDIKILRLMIKWIYTGEIEVVELQEQMNLFKAAHKYEIDSLKSLCVATISSNISYKNVLEIYAFVEPFEETQIQRKALEIIKSNKQKVFGDGKTSEEFIKRFPKVMLELVKD